MLKTLILKNLALVEGARIDFENGFTIITGETGAGKTALIEAIRLILGEKKDVSKVRKGCEKAFVQAAFEMSMNPQLEQIFASCGIAPPTEEDSLIISREIPIAGKSRFFVNGQMAPAAFLLDLAPHLVDFISQHAQVSLRNEETQRHFLDVFTGIDLSEFHRLWETEKQLQLAYGKLVEKKGHANQRKALLENQLTELVNANVQEGEDEALFEEYTLLSHSQEILASTEQILSLADQSVTASLGLPPLLDGIAKLDPSAVEMRNLAKEALLQLQELVSQVQRLQAKMESDPHRLSYLEERLKTIDRLKKKYGKHLVAFQKELIQELENLDKIDEDLADLSQQLVKAKQQTTLACQAISKHRQEGALQLEKLLSASLRELNISTAELLIKLTPCTRTQSGEDSISFLLRANQGEEPTLVKNSSSGGELSRILFALKIALADKGQPKTMLFDEIDANVGGETARMIGQKLQELGRLRQVLCITHFPQVASLADQHLRVFKEEREGRTYSSILPLDAKAKEVELLRMLGGQSGALAHPLSK